MGALDVFFHLLNFVAPALVTAALSAGVCKLIYRRDLQAVSWIRLATGASLPGVVVLALGLWWFGRDGKMATYGALVVVQALALAWIGWRPIRPRTPRRARSGAAPE